jgi:hypothetical protein
MNKAPIIHLSHLHLPFTFTSCDQAEPGLVNQLRQDGHTGKVKLDQVLELDQP